MTTSAEQPHTKGPSLPHLPAPRAAALAGVVFAILFGVIVVLIGTSLPEGVRAASAWPNSPRGGIKVATVMMPFAGISFLWFIGVVRDGLGRVEDRFFSTVFLGSGLLFLAMMFVATAVAAGLVATNKGIADPAAHVEVFNFGKMVLLEASLTYALRMAAVFMIALATIWLKTGLMPRWLVVLSYLAALALLIVSDVSLWITMAFPVWVLVVSGIVLARTQTLKELQARND